MAGIHSERVRSPSPWTAVGNAVPHRFGMRQVFPSDIRQSVRHPRSTEVMSLALDELILPERPTAGSASESGVAFSLPAALQRKSRACFRNGGLMFDSGKSLARRRIFGQISSNRIGLSDLQKAIVMKQDEIQISPIISVNHESGRITVDVNDDELRDYVEDHLTENFDGLEVESHVGTTLVLAESAKLDRVAHAISLLSQAEIKRIWRLSNPRGQQVREEIQNNPVGS